MKPAKRFVFAALILIIAAMLIVLPACSKKQKSYEQIVHEFYEDRKDKLPDWVTEEYCMEFYQGTLGDSTDDPRAQMPKPGEKLSPDDFSILYGEWVDYSKDYYEDGGSN